MDSEPMNESGHENFGMPHTIQEAQQMFTDGKAMSGCHFEN